MGIEVLGLATDAVTLNANPLAISILSEVRLLRSGWVFGAKDPI